MPVKKLLHYPSKKTILKYILIFISGFLLMLSITFYMQWSYEDEVITNLVKKIKEENPLSSSDSLINDALRTCTYLEERRTEIFSKYDFHSLGTKLIPYSFAPFSYGRQACGGYTLFLARILKKLDFDVKVVLLNVKDYKSRHIALCVKRDNKLLLLDPFYNLAFKDSSGNLSDIQDVANNWSTFYKNKVPAGYNKDYDYQSGWRFTNWDKLGFVSRFIYSAGVFILGKKKMNSISLGVYFLEINKYYFIISLLGFFLFMWMFFINVRTNKRDLKSSSKAVNKIDYAFPLDSAFPLNASGN